MALALWATVLLRSAADGRLDLLLRAAFHPLVAAAGLLLLALAGLQLAVALRDPQGRCEPLRRRSAVALAATTLVATLVL
ncbi:MAG: TIGR03943 family protein, partial [Cyanobium sp.]